MTPKEYEAAISKEIPEAIGVRVIVPDIVSAHLTNPTPVWIVTFSIETSNKMLVPFAWQTIDPQELVTTMKVMAMPFLKKALPTD